MRLAFVDMIFSWPPNGGADADLYHVLCGLQRHGCELKLFVTHEEGSSDRGLVEPATLPFPCEKRSFARRDLTPARVAGALREAVDAYQPDLVFIHHGFTLKPYVTDALAHHRIVVRYYSHELTCARGGLRFRDGKPCPHDYLRTPDECRTCALDFHADALKRLQLNTWLVDYLASGAYRPEYHATVVESLRRVDAIIVSNASLKADLEGFHDRVVVLPGGVDADAVPFLPMPERGPGERKVILITGRVDDPLKGLDVLLEAGGKLAETRDDFEVWATHYDHALSRDWFKALGWKDHAGALALYGEADIVVVPSVWEEPFGLVAVEAMAAGRPVCASRVGGLQEIVRHGETGFLFERGDSAALAEVLAQLLDSPALCARFGAAGRAVVEREYTWDTIITRHYLPLIEDLCS